MVNRNEPSTLLRKESIFQFTLDTNTKKSRENTTSTMYVQKKYGTTQAVGTVHCVVASMDLPLIKPQFDSI